MEKPRRQTTARRSIAEAIELQAKAVETTAPSTLATTAGSLEIPPQSPASRATLLGWTWWTRRAASLWRQPSRLRELARALRVIIRLARM
jgi:hypothetical protein